jgi:hypothetical protein
MAWIGWFASGYVPVDVGRSLLSVGISARIPRKRLLVAPPDLEPGVGAERPCLWQMWPEQIRLKFSFLVGLPRAWSTNPKPVTATLFDPS